MTPLTQDAYDASADKAWAVNPRLAFHLYGLPCWCGHYGGCRKCGYDR